MANALRGVGTALVLAFLLLTIRLATLSGPGCVAYQKALSSWDLERDAESPAGRDPLSFTTMRFASARKSLERWERMEGEYCSLASTDELFPIHRRSDRICRRAVDLLRSAGDQISFGADAEAADCLLRLAEYQMLLTERRYGNFPAAAVKDVKAVTQLLFAEGLRARGRPARMVELAQRLQELAPDSRLARTFLMETVLRAYEKDRSARHQVLFTRQLEGMKGPLFADRDELRLDYFRVARQVEDLTRLAAQRAAESDDAVGPYYLAWGRYLKGDGRGAEEALWEALRRAPHRSDVYGTVIRFLERSPASPDSEIFEGPQLYYGMTVYVGRYGLGDSVQVEPAATLPHPKEFIHRDYPPNLWRIFPTGRMNRDELQRLRGALVKLKSASLAP